MNRNSAHLFLNRAISDAIRFYVSVHHGIDGESWDGLDAELLGDVFAMADDRSEADIQFLGYLFIDKTFGN